MLALYESETKIGSIQEDRHKVEQFHFLWNSSTFYGTVPQFVEQRPKNVEQLPKKWNRSCNRASIPQNRGTEGQIKHFKFVGTP